ncbi:hypothetical protein [Ktedonobacter robiniae]|uniref:Uncharacterized protein n=1 Tax=Ktedonobacter robiniae TaxID=2778365 RepID=A0ABQ3V7A4_9CHLR|nr:hypothetical protein [Ktedonobacter robiniae]GHO60798.1 hypothetical protein KSB_92730 [Ktedonobacter robiniae]
MTRPSLVCFLALGLLLPTLMSSIYWHDSLHGGKQQAHRSMGIPAPHILDLAQAFTQEERTQTRANNPYDSRPCAGNPSPTNCNGVLPVIPHFSPDNRDSGNGFCFDHQPHILEDQQLTNAAGQRIGTLQLWYFTGCESYAAHLLARPDANGQQPTLQLQVDQYDGSGILNGITQLFWHLGDEEKLLPSTTQAIGPLQEQEIWSPLLFSPDAPVRASAILHVNQQTSTAFSGYYANGQPTTINGQNS